MLIKEDVLSDEIVRSLKEEITQDIIELEGVWNKKEIPLDTLSNLSNENYKVSSLNDTNIIITFDIDIF